MENKIKDKIQKYLEQKGHVVDPGVNLFECGAIDSTEIIEMIVFIENEFKFTLDSQDVLGSNFETIDAIVKLITKNMSSNISNA